MSGLNSRPGEQLALCIIILTIYFVQLTQLPTHIHFTQLPANSVAELNLLFSRQGACMCCVLL